MTARPSFADIAREFTNGNPMRLGVPHTSCNTVCNSIREWRMPCHEGLATVIAVLASKVKDNGSLSEKAKRSVVEQLDELADEIDQDKTNQEAERAYQLATRS
jgi:hypothetical protein